MKLIMTKLKLLLCVLSCALLINGGAAEEAALAAAGGADGSLILSANGKTLAELRATLFDEQWGTATAAGTSVKNLALKTKAGAQLKVEPTFIAEGGVVRAAYVFTPQSDLKLNGLTVAADFAIGSLADTKWTMDDAEGTFPSEHKETMLRVGMVKRLVLRPRGAPEITLAFDAPLNVLLQDNRQWNTPTFSLRIGQGGQFKKGEKTTLAFALSSSVPVALTQDGPVTIVAGTDWIPLKTELEIEAGSALDFSKMSLTDAPAGKHGRVVCREDGQFVFENDRATARRFYGVNICFGAQYLPHEQADKLAERFARIGYNALRIHHYEGQLTQGKPSTELNDESIDQLDYLIDAMAKRGIYTTTDLFVSRPVKFKDVGIDKPGNVGMDEFKIMVPVRAEAFENWKKFTRTLLEHVNKYSGKRYADDPALAWLALINEGCFGNFTGLMQNIPEWKAQWNYWLRVKYTDRAALAKEWGGALKPGEDALNSSVAAPQNVYGGNARARDENLFLAEKEREMVLKMEDFLRTELKCKALISNSSAWTNHATDQLKREVYDYVDDHFYVDHPQFLQGDWRLPSRCANSSPIAGGATGGRNCAFTRVFGKPFTITEFNYACPGRFRGVGGILTGAMGALQGWSGMWRFAYAHDKSFLFAPAKLDYFDMVADPLGQAAERASICLYLRGDMRMAPHALPIALSNKELKHPPVAVPGLSPGWNWAAWLTRVGTTIEGVPSGLDERTGKPAGEMNAFALKTPEILAELKTNGIVNAGNLSDPAKNIFYSETGEISIDAPLDKMILDTPRTAGGYARVGSPIVTRDGGVSISITGSDATVWVSAVDAEPIAKSKRLIVTHLTDLQNTEIKYAEQARKTLLDWGKLPHLVRNGKAVVRIKLATPEKFDVFALSTGGRRLGIIETKSADGALEFSADVNGKPDEGARMLYEIVAR